MEGEIPVDSMEPLTFTYDEESDAAYIYMKYPIGRGEVVRTGSNQDLPSMTSITFDYDKHDKLIGIEILGATRVLPSNLLKRWCGSDAAD